jgi:hypothetical protein
LLGKKIWKEKIFLSKLLLLDEMFIVFGFGKSERKLSELFGVHRFP